MKKTFFTILLLAGVFTFFSCKTSSEEPKVEEEYTVEIIDHSGEYFQPKDLKISFEDESASKDFEYEIGSGKKMIKYFPTFKLDWDYESTCKDDHLILEIYGSCIETNKRNVLMKRETWYSINDKSQTCGIDWLSNYLGYSLPNDANNEDLTWIKEVPDTLTFSFYIKAKAGYTDSPEKTSDVVIITLKRKGSY